MTDNDQPFKATSEPLPDTTGFSRDEAQIAWALAAQKGCSRALALLLDSVESLIWKEVRRWTFGALGYEATQDFMTDAFVECRLAIFRRLHTYDPIRAGFATFASWQIKGACSNWIRNNATTVHVPARFAEKCQDVFRATAAFVEHYGRDPSVDELSDRTGLSAKHVTAVHNFGTCKIVSLDAPLHAESHKAHIDNLSCATDIDHEHTETLDRLHALVEQLPKRERYIIEKRFGLKGDEMTLAAVGNKFGVSRERIRQLEAQAIRLLKRIATGDTSALQLRHKEANSSSKRAAYKKTRQAVVVGKTEIQMAMRAKG